ncbi:MAG: ABC transporter ATP-binding protein [Rhodospirillales bacterium]|nr:ABC transporter ATP-binding protein [Rhodospirillales bacterium]
MNAPDAAALVRLEGAGKRFDNGTVALAGLDLALRRGEFLSILGPSGCGKTTVLRLIAGLAQPSAGRVAWAEPAGRDGRDALGFVFQEPTLLPWRTARGNVALPLILAGVARTEARARAETALAAVGLEGAGHLFARQLSGGMRMRVSIARALVTRPALLLMDEPFAALDEITRERLNADLLRLWREQALTVAFVTHSVYESVFLSMRVVVMARAPGRVAEEITIAAPYPRTESFRAGADYAAACRQVSAALRRAMGEEA